MERGVRWKALICWNCWVVKKGLRESSWRYLSDRLPSMVTKLKYGRQGCSVVYTLMRWKICVPVGIGCCFYIVVLFAILPTYVLALEVLRVQEDEVDVYVAVLQLDGHEQHVVEQVHPRLQLGLLRQQGGCGLLQLAIWKIKVHIAS